MLQNLKILTLVHHHYRPDKAISKQADLIRRYIIESQTILKQTAKTDAIRDSATPTKDSNTEQERDRLPELLTAMLALEDKALVGLFVPMQDVYQDLALGKGRISVINDADVFNEILIQTLKLSILN